MYTKLEFELKFITPAFIGEAFPDDTDLRPASLIGSLRYWFRQLLGTLTDDVEKIYNLESVLFGNQNRAGLVRVRVEPIKNITQQIGSEELSALAYIGYGNLRFKEFREKNGRKIPIFVNAKPYIKPGSKYRITFLVPKKLEELFLSFLYLYNFLGSLGGRNRRGWGNFVLRPKGENFSEKQIWEFFNKKIFESKYKNFKNQIHKVTSPFSNSKLWEFLLYKVFSTKKLNTKNEDPLSWISEKYCIFRNRFPLNISEDLLKKFQLSKCLDYFHLKFFMLQKLNCQINSNHKNRHEICKKITDEEIRKIKCSSRNSKLIYNRIWFGLPIRVQYSSLIPAEDRKNKFKRIKNKSKTKKNKCEATISFFIKSGNKLQVSRLASPIIFRVVQIEPNTFSLLLIVKKYDKILYANNTWNIPNLGTPKVPYQVVEEKNNKKQFVTKFESVYTQLEFDKFLDLFLKFLNPSLNVNTPLLILP